MKLLNFRPLSGVAGGSDTSRTQLLYKTESVFAEVPAANPPMTQLRFTRSSINHRNRTGVSADIRSDRMRTDSMILAYGVDGGFEAELHSATFSTHLGGYEDLVEAALCGTWTTNVLKNGTTFRSFNFEQGYVDIGRYISYRGITINGLTLNIQANQFVTLGFDVMGTQGFIASTSLIGTGTLTSPNTLSPITAGPYITGLSANADLSGVKVRTLRLNVANNLREKMGVDAYTSGQFGMGSCDVTGTLEIYFTNSLAYADFLANNFIDFTFNIIDLPAANGGTSWAIRMPKMKLTAGTADISGVDDDVYQNFDFRAHFDTTNNCELMITRSAA